MVKRLSWIFAVLLLFACSAKADGIANIYFNGGYAFANNGYGIPPYSGTLNGQPAEFYCVDFSHDITGNTGWQATVTTLPTTNYSNTRLDNATDYAEIAWLLDQSLASTNQTTQAELQWAVWSFSSGDQDPYGTNSMLLMEAANAVKNGFQPTGWEILTPTGNYGQEFMVQTPEPAEVVLLGLGLLFLMGIARKRTFGLAVSS